MKDGLPESGSVLRPPCRLPDLTEISIGWDIPCIFLKATADIVNGSENDDAIDNTEGNQPGF
jgi:hypothetical protein